MKLTNKQLIIELRALIWGGKPPPKSSVLHTALLAVVNEIEKRLIRPHGRGDGVTDVDIER